MQRYGVYSSNIRAHVKVVFIFSQFYALSHILHPAFNESSTSPLVQGGICVPLQY